MASTGVALSGVLVVLHLIWYVGGWGNEDLRAYVTDGLYSASSPPGRPGPAGPARCC